MTQAARVTITGAAGQIGYQLAFRIASGQLLGPNQPVILQLLEITPALGALKGVVMELEDCAFPALQGVVATDQAAEAFRDADYALLVGAKPRGPGMERADLLKENAKIFSTQGKAMNEHASRSVRVLVVGNPANTNALIAQRNAPDLNPGQLHRHDAPRSQPRAGAARREDRHPRHPDQAHDHLGQSLRHPVPGHQPGAGQRSRGERPRRARNGSPMNSSRRCSSVVRPSSRPAGCSSAASAASSAIDHVRDWALGTPGDDWVSMAVPADGSYGIREGVIYSFPCRCAKGKYEIVQGLPISDFSRARMDATDKELREERAAIADLLPR